jgi:hypothetical protein
MIFESRRQPVKGLDKEPCGLIGGGSSLSFYSNAASRHFAGDSTVP